MPLSKGPNSVRKNVTELMQPMQSKSRKKAVLTIAKRNGINRKDAQFKQALAISRAQARKT